MTSIVLYTGKSLVSKGSSPKAFMMHVGEGKMVLVLLEEEGARIPTVVSDVEKNYLFALPDYTEIELLVRVRDGH